MPVASGVQQVLLVWKPLHLDLLLLVLVPIALQPIASLVPLPNVQLQLVPIWTTASIALRQRDAVGASKINPATPSIPITVPVETSNALLPITIVSIDPLQIVHV